MPNIESIWISDATILFCNVLEFLEKHRLYDVMELHAAADAVSAVGRGTIRQTHAIRCLLHCTEATPLGLSHKHYNSE